MTIDHPHDGEPAANNGGVRGMGGEGSVEFETPPPIRFSGFLALLLAFLSVFCLLTPGLIAFPLAAIVLGGIALRPSRGPKPIGATPARIAIVLAVGLGVCGFGLFLLRGQTLREQATYFGRQFLEVVAEGHHEYALELKKRETDRSLPTTPLKELYQREKAASESLVMFRDDLATRFVEEAGPDAGWELAGSPKAYRYRGVDMVETRWFDPDRPGASRVRVVLEYLPDQEQSQGHWVVQTFDLERPDSDDLADVPPANF